MNRPRIEKPLKHFLEYGIKLIPTYPDGRTLGTWKDPGNFTAAPDRIAAYWKEGFRRFQFHPIDNGLLCFDIDRKKGKDGLLELYRLFETSAMPSYLVDAESFPAVTVTPSGGLHLYFKYTGEKYKSGEIAEGLEAVHYNHLLTAPGSRKESGEYTFYGDLNQAPQLPPVLQNFLTEYREQKKLTPVWTYNQTERGPLSLEDIRGIIDRQGEYSPEASRNRYTYEIAKFAQRKGYSAGAVETYIRGMLEAPDFNGEEISRTVESAYKGIV